MRCKSFLILVPTFKSDHGMVHQPIAFVWREAPKPISRLLIGDVGEVVVDLR